MNDVIAWPQKTREIHSHHFDSTVWNDFEFRDDDIVIGTYAKSGTTWMQQIVSQLIFRGEEGLPVADISPWYDMRVPAKEIKLSALLAQNHRRFIKTHLPVDALVFSPKAKYIYIARDGRDVAWSAYNHFRNFSPEAFALLNETPGLVGPPMPPMPDDVMDFYVDWFENDGGPLWSLWENIRSWWEIRELPNVMLVHFANLKADLEGEMRAIADFLDIEIEEELWPTLLDHCSFEYMRANGETTVPLGGMPWKGGAKTFLHKGTNGRWRDRLSAQQVADYDAKALEELGPECARWLETGEMGLQ